MGMSPLALRHSITYVEEGVSLPRSDPLLYDITCIGEKDRRRGWTTPPSTYVMYYTSVNMASQTLYAAYAVCGPCHRTPSGAPYPSIPAARYAELHIPRVP